MSTPPKEPKPGAGSALESTFLGVAPAAPEHPSTPAAGSGGGGSAIIAAPMISVSGERKARGPAAPAAPVSPAPAEPVRHTALQGGWQSAGVARPQSPDQTALHGTPGAWPVVAPARPSVDPTPAPSPAVRPGLQTHVGRAAATQPGQQGSAAPPAAYPQPQYSQQQHPQQQYTPPQAQYPQQHAPQPYPAQPYPAQPHPAQPYPPQPPAPPPQYPPAAGPGAGGGLHHTALASDYLRAAREAALGGAVAPRATPAAPVAEQRAPRSPHVPAAPVAYEPSPPTQLPVSEPVPTAPPATPESVYPTPPPSMVAPVSTPPPTAAPPLTAPLSEPGPLPYAQPAALQPVVAYAPDVEPLHGPRSIGTQASVAPPLTGKTPAVPFAPPALHAALAPAPNPVRFAPPQPIAGTMLERTPSIPGSALAGPPPTAPASAVPTPGSGGHATRFEQVPSARSSLSQQQTGFGLQIPIDQSAADWGRGGLDQTGGAKPAGKGKEKPGSQLRLLLLAALAMVAIGFAAFGTELLGGSERAREETAQGGNWEAAAPADQTTLTNLPAPAAPVANAVPGVAQPSLAAVPAAPAPALAPTAPAAIVAAPPGEPAEEQPSEPVDPADAKAAEAAHKEAEAAASPESKLAAQAARHVLVARYADALPLYRQLQQSFPQNISYAAMVRVLEQKTAAANKGAQP